MKLRPVCREHMVPHLRRVRVVRGLDVLDEEDREAAARRSEPYRRGRVPPRGHLDRVQPLERFEQPPVGLEGARGHLELEPTRLLAERKELDLMAASR